jgi:hypothetical protein
MIHIEFGDARAPQRASQTASVTDSLALAGCGHRPGRRLRQPVHSLVAANRVRRRFV